MVLLGIAEHLGESIKITGSIICFRRIFSVIGERHSKRLLILFFLSVIVCFLQSANVLIHYDKYKQIVLACGASPCGVGTVLSHKLEDGSE